MSLCGFLSFFHTKHNKLPNLYNAEIFFYKPWRTKGFMNLKS